ncbi:hypothetical protein GOODEAATRI_001652, partial [Goodea atripinnis]
LSLTRQPLGLPRVPSLCIQHGLESKALSANTPSQHEQQGGYALRLAHQPILSCNSRGEVAGGRYRSILPRFSGREAAKKQGQTNGSGTSASRGTGLLGKLQFPGEPLCHVLRLSVTRPGCLCRSSSRRAKPGLTWNEPGISGSVGNFIYTWLIGTVGLWAVVTEGYGYRCASLLPCATRQNWA